MASVWTCQRSADGVKCGAENPGRVRKCGVCGKARPARKRPAHMAALDLSYEHYIEINGGVEACGICGAARKPERRLQRDHDHRGEGTPRGLLCYGCNRWLRAFMTVDWMRKAIAYLERAEKRVQS